MVNEAIGNSEDAVMNDPVPVLGSGDVIEPESETFERQFIDDSDIFFGSHDPGQDDKVLCDDLQRFGLHGFHGFAHLTMVFVLAGDVAEAFIGTAVELSVAGDALSAVDSGLFAHKKKRFLFKLGEKFVWSQQKKRENNRF